MDEVAVMDAEPSLDKGINTATNFLSIFMVMSQLTQHLLQPQRPPCPQIPMTLTLYIMIVTILTPIDTLYAHVANHHTEENKKKHIHWKPFKLSSLPPADV